MVRMPEVIKQWLGPSGVSLIFTCIIGGIVWGVQINFALLKLADKNAAAITRVEKVEEAMNEASINMLRITVILERLQEDMKATNIRAKALEIDTGDHSARLATLEERTRGGSGQ